MGSDLMRGLCALGSFVIPLGVAWVCAVREANRKGVPTRSYRRHKG
jgi:hypothetical protein